MITKILWVCVTLVYAQNINSQECQTGVDQSERSYCPVGADNSWFSFCNEENKCECLAMMESYPKTVEAYTVLLADDTGSGSSATFTQICETKTKTPCQVFEETTPCTTSSHCTEAGGSPSCICDDDFEYDGIGNCIRIDYCDRVSEANYVCSNPDSECVTENDAGACTCINGFHAYSIVDGLYVVYSEGIFLDGSNIYCANPFPCSTDPCNAIANSVCVTATIDNLLQAQCECGTGYEDNGVGALTCVDTNECTNGSGYCNETEDCANNDGSFTCSCRTGYVANTDAENSALIPCHTDNRTETEKNNDRNYIDEGNSMKKMNVKNHDGPLKDYVLCGDYLVEYQFVNISLTLPDARAHCAALDMSLTAPKSQCESDKLEEITRHGRTKFHLGSIGFFWLNMQTENENHPKTYKYEDGSPVTFFDWQTIPEDQFDGAHYGENVVSTFKINCVAQAIGLTYTGKINGVNQFDDTESYGWIQLWCESSMTRYFVCEKRPLASNLVQSCDLSTLAVVKQLVNGKYDWSDDYQMKTQPKNPATGERLAQPGKVKKAKAEFVHKSTELDYSDGWIVCKSNKFALSLVKCFSDGTLEVDGKTGDQIVMPDCTKLGCDVSELGAWNSKTYDKTDGCKKGTFEQNGKVFENDKNVCSRYCDLEQTIKASKRIKCVCDYAAASCSFQARISGASISIHALKENGDKYIKTDICEVTIPTTTTTAVFFDFEDINYDVPTSTLRSLGFKEYFSALGGQGYIKYGIEPPLGAVEVFMGCGDVNSNVLKMGAVATPAELFDQRDYPYKVESNAKTVRNFYAYYNTFQYEAIGFSKTSTIKLHSYDVYDLSDESKLTALTTYSGYSLWRCGSIEARPSDYYRSYKIVFYYR